MNTAKLEAEFLENPNPSRTALRRIANANGMDVVEVERWFELKRLSSVVVDGPEVQDLVPDHNVPGPSDARRSVRRARERSERQEQDQPPVKRPVVVDPAIQKTNEKLDLYLRNPRSQDFFMGIRKIIGAHPSEAEAKQARKIIGVNPETIRHWTRNKGLLTLPVVQVQGPTIDRTQASVHQPQNLFEGVYRPSRQDQLREGQRLSNIKQQERERQRERAVLLQQNPDRVDHVSPPTTPDSLHGMEMSRRFQRDLIELGQLPRQTDVQMEFEIRHLINYLAVYQEEDQYVLDARRDLNELLEIQEARRRRRRREGQ